MLTLRKSDTLALRLSARAFNCDTTQAIGVRFFIPISTFARSSCLCTRIEKNKKPGGKNLSSVMLVWRRNHLCIKSSRQKNADTALATSCEAIFFNQIYGYAFLTK